MPALGKESHRASIVPIPLKGYGDPFFAELLLRRLADTFLRCIRVGASGLCWAKTQIAPITEWRTERPMLGLKNVSARLTAAKTVGA